MSSVNQSRASGEYGRGGRQDHEAGSGYACIILESTGKVLKEFKSEGSHSVTAADLVSLIGF